jgi:hypothetical protein
VPGKMLRAESIVNGIGFLSLSLQISLNHEASLN